MTDHDFSLALWQFNPTVGNFAGNAEQIIAAYRRAAKAGADLLLTSEMALWGYPPEDLLRQGLGGSKGGAWAAAAAALDKICQATRTSQNTKPCAILLGSAIIENHQIYNAALLIEDGRIKATRKKYLLPNYGVFDDKRNYAQGELAGPLLVAGVKIGVMICEDMWGEEVSECLAESGAELLLVMNASPYEHGKAWQRDDHAVARVKETGLPLVYLNQFGGQDELVFDGASFALSVDAKRVMQLPAFVDSLVVTKWRRDGEGKLTLAEPAPIAAEINPLAMDYQA
ncbi:MAG: NAD+ synthase, partial [Alphaproteobacteria bacterium]|nr:NAD+ synthase [Alphaproteobacteria bacterium]